MERLAREKAEAVTASPDDVVVAADTTVAFAGHILGKPVDAADARRMLLLLSDQTHEVHTGVAVRTGRPDRHAGRDDQRGDGDDLGGRHRLVRRHR